MTYLWDSNGFHPPVVNVISRKKRPHQFEISPQDAQVFVVASTVYGHGRPRRSSRFPFFVTDASVPVQYPNVILVGLASIITLFVSISTLVFRWRVYFIITSSLLTWIVSLDICHYIILSNHVGLVSALSLINGNHIQVIVARKNCLMKRRGWFQVSLQKV